MCVEERELLCYMYEGKLPVGGREGVCRTGTEKEGERKRKKRK